MSLFFSNDLHMPLMDKSFKVYTEMYYIGRIKRGWANKSTVILYKDTQTLDNARTY